LRNEFAQAASALDTTKTDMVLEAMT